MEVKVSPSGNELMAAWREGSHDNLVFAVALAGWAGRKRHPRPTGQDAYWLNPAVMGFPRSRQVFTFERRVAGVGHVCPILGSVRGGEFVRRLQGLGRQRGVEVRRLPIGAREPTDFSLMDRT